ncbi:MAG: hypothetical protein GY715_21835 [Planctomycetes bacterium]|nr:hypothetical protein [Planctomycetota bacterium]
MLRWVLFILVGVIGLVGAAGCASAERVEAEPAGPVIAPADFSLDATILRGRDADAATEVARRPGRYVLFPDGSLHAAAWEGVGPTDLPPRSRTLSREQVDDLWRAATALGLTDPARGTDPTNLAMIEPPRDGMTSLLVFSARGRRWLVRHDDPGPDDAAIRVVRRLAQLGWVSEHPDPQVFIIPRRYDLGPDPYARFLP